MRMWMRSAVRVRMRVPVRVHNAIGVRVKMSVQHRRRTVAVLEGVNDHENLGALFRNAAALGVDGVLLSPTCADPLYRRAVRVSIRGTQESRTRPRPRNRPER